MVTESVSHQPAARHPRASGTLAVDLAADAADLLDVSAVLGLEFRRVVAALLRAPERPAADVVRTLASRPPRMTPPSGEAPPFVWVRFISPGRRPKLTVRAGWLVPATVHLIAAEARAAGGDTEVQVIVPLDSGEAAAARVRALCAGIAPDVKLTIDVQGEEPGGRRRAERRGRWRPSGPSSSPDPRRADHRFGTGTWIVFGPLGAMS